MVDLRCTKCDQSIRAKIDVVNLTALLTYKIFKTKVNGNVTQLLGDSTSVQVAGVFCANCNEDRNEETIKGLCAATRKYVPLTDLRIFGIKITGPKGVKQKTFKIIATPGFNLKRYLAGKEGEIAFENPIKLDWKTP